jgi:hypothetical protein
MVLLMLLLLVTTPKLLPVYLTTCDIESGHPSTPVWGDGVK